MHSSCLWFATVTVALGIASNGANATSIERMFDKLEPALTTMAGVNECGLRPSIGRGLFRYAEARVKTLEEESGLSAEELTARRLTALDEGRAT